jgi:hypothetical protein
MCIVKLYLDDIRVPRDSGYKDDDWIVVRDVASMKQLITDNGKNITQMSLDHDLGACDACMKGRTVDQWLEESGYSEMPNCSHVGTGYDLVKWMAEHNLWPATPPRLHTANPVGRGNMKAVIDRYFN